MAEAVTHRIERSSFHLHLVGTSEAVCVFYPACAPSISRVRFKQDVVSTDSARESYPNSGCIIPILASGSQEAAPIYI